MNIQDNKKSNTLVVAYIAEMPRIEMIHEFVYSLASQKYAVDVLLIHEGLSESELEILQEVIDKPTIKVSTADPMKPGSPGEMKEMSAIFPLNYTLVQNKLESFPDVFNLAFQSAMESGYEFFSIMEPDDVMSISWIKTAQTYAVENPEVGIFSPIIRNTVHGAFQGYFNEAVWAEGMAEEAGKYDQTLLLQFNCVTPLGAVYRVSSLLKEEDAIEERDGIKFPMKNGIKLVSSYEFFLRMVYNDIKVMNVPRAGYEMRILRRDKAIPTSAKIPPNITSLPKEVGGFTQKEANFWLKSATDAYFIESDEVIDYKE